MKTTQRILTAPFHAIAWTLSFTCDVLSHVNPLLLAVYILSDE